MAKQTVKASPSNARKKVQIKDLSEPAKKLSAKQLKNVKGGKASTTEITIPKLIDKGSSK